MGPQELKGHLDGLILAMLEAGPLHGYAVITALREHSSGALELPAGTIYPVLHRLERRGLIAGTWSEGAGRKRRIYALTTTGRKDLAAQRDNWNTFSRLISRVLTAGGTP
ncbi:DNA-binding PadR family transcriptional regulator [Kibdelosporangium banguiense]|uniref:DNA-binding PadR family transcriptional regulator n=1 Tax=Kibdelosporangium banguiense TaxID=1365924 RepID=A0ABS4TGM4_9PSEU|nr:helix-turn-helix transcriptional regulator [Kibdelosporangium banguiense]MBP2323124.1 DNA-binding PadR family transcriptional regulator [Kibdelosporangium banguiense]